MKAFYSSAFILGNHVYLRGIDKFGRRIQEKIEYSPYLFVKGDGEYQGLFGERLSKIDFLNVKDAKEFVERYKKVTNFDIHGMTNFIYPFLNDTYPGEMEFDITKLNIGAIDIECMSDDGFPNVELADKPITAITLQCKEKVHVFGCGDFVIDKNEYSAYDIRYHKCINEQSLLLKFIDQWREFNLDIITGWGIEFFDIRYIVNRIKKVLGDDAPNKLSPWGIIHNRGVRQQNSDEEINCYNIRGIAALDYLELYKKYTYTGQETYKLDHIANVELGKRKLDYSEYDSLHDLYIKDHQKFIAYNIRDTILIDELDEKLGFLSQAVSIAYTAKINFNDIFSPVNTWEVIIHNYLLEKGIAVPPRKSSIKKEAYAGAYVKEPQVGMYKWVLSFDVTSLYPSIIVQYNLSPETFINRLNQFDDVDELLENRLNFGIYEGETITANGCRWSIEKQGILPVLVEHMMNSRSLYKKKMIAAEKEYEINPSNQVKNDIARYNNLQMAFKILLNSLYGASGNVYFRYYSIEYAEAITLTGQLIIQWIEKRMNEYLNGLFKTKDVNYIIASDTDSIYINLGTLVEKFMSDKTDNEIIDFLDKIAKEKLEVKLAEFFQEIADSMNVYKNFMKMKREAICNKAVWTGKKHYILNVYDNEGVRYSEPKLKMKGIEAVKSSTPAICKERIKEALKLLMNTDEKTVQKFVAKFREEFNSLPFEDVAQPRGCNGIHEYGLPEGAYKKGTPMHVRAALVYNNAIKKAKLHKRYPLIKEGEKLKYCYMSLPNPLQENVFAISTVLPKELKLETYIDRNTQFDKTFGDPVQSILSVIGWNIEEQSTLEDFFT